MDQNVPQSEPVSPNQSDNNFSLVPQPLPEAPPPVVPQEVLSAGLPPVPKHSANWLVIGAIAGVIVLTGIGGFVLLKKGQNGQVPSGSGSGLFGGSSLQKYEKDADGDGYPDAIEQAVGLNPAISELTRCTNNSCDSANLQNTQKVHNVLIILDGSGSMAAKIGTMTKMDAAKAAIRNYVSQSAAIAELGLMVYGQAGSNSDKDKAVSCASAVMVGSFGTVNAASIDSQLAGVKPIGWTPMGYALQQALSQFSGRSADNNEIILVSDGAESCNTNPVGAAATLKSAGVKVNIIAFAALPSELSSLQQIASAGGGTYASVNSYEELDRKFSDQYENGLKLLEQGKCENAALDVFTKCWSDAYNKVSKWISDTKISYFQTKAITKEEYDYLDDLSGKVFKIYKDESNRQLELFNQKADQINKQIRGE
jgi:Mg-chelatase subunit ChlD